MTLENKRIVVIGGGTGQGNVVAALKNITGHISAIVTMADDGGSTGRLRKYYNAPAVGDIRNVLVKLADKNNIFSQLLPYRYGNDRWGENAVDIEGHNLGNLILLALIDITGSLKKALKVARQQLEIVDHYVLPSTYDNVVLCARYNGGEKICSQYKISNKLPRSKKFGISSLWLEKQPNKKEQIIANPEAIDAINHADYILIGPGALHGSVLPNLLIKSITKAIISSHAPKYFIANTAIKLSESKRLSLEDHIQILLNLTDERIIDKIIVNSKLPHLKEKEITYLSTKERKICNKAVIKADLIDEKDLFMHDPRKLKKILIKVLK